MNFSFFRTDRLSRHRCDIGVSAIKMSIPMFTPDAVRKKTSWSIQCFGSISFDQPVQIATWVLACT